MKFKSVFESLENYYCNSVKYESTCHEPKKDQIKADAMVHVIKFIDWCFRKEGKTMNYDIYLAQCVEDYFNEETPDEKQERIESHLINYDEWRDDNEENK